MAPLPLWVPAPRVGVAVVLTSGAAPRRRPPGQERNAILFRFMLRRVCTERRGPPLLVTSRITGTTGQTGTDRPEVTTAGSSFDRVLPPSSPGRVFGCHPIGSLTRAWS